MTYIKINETLYPATVSGRTEDRDWDKRKSKAITVEMDYTAASVLFMDDLDWSIVVKTEASIPLVDDNGEAVLDENGSNIFEIVENSEEFDNSEYCVAGTITDNRDGTVTVKMGVPTDGELLAILTGEAE